MKLWKTLKVGNSLILIDSRDFPKLKGGRLGILSGYPYVEFTETRNFKGTNTVWKTRILLHRLVKSAKDGELVDHVKGNLLDVRRGSLRFATHTENMRNRRLPLNNTTGFKGVISRQNGWTVQINVNKKVRHLGTYSSKEVAARVYDREALREFGEFARLNFPEDRATALDYLPPFEKRLYLTNNTGFRGVVERNGKFGVILQKDKKQFSFGRYPTAEEAARVYDREAVKAFGPKAKLNFEP